MGDRQEIKENCYLNLQMKMEQMNPEAGMIKLFLIFFLVLECGSLWR